MAPHGYGRHDSACADIDQAVLVGGVLGRGHVRRLHTLPHEDPGTPAAVPQLLPNSRLQMLLRGQNCWAIDIRRHRGGSLRGQGARTAWSFPRLRCPQRHPQPARPWRPCGAPASTRREPSATPSAAAYPRRFREMPKNCFDLGCDSLHQGQAALLKRSRPMRSSKALKTRAGRTYGFTCTCTPPQVSPWSA